MGGRKARGGKGKRSERGRIKERGGTDQRRDLRRAGEILGGERETGVWSGGHVVSQRRGAGIQEPGARMRLSHRPRQSRSGQITICDRASRRLAPAEPRAVGCGVDSLLIVRSGGRAASVSRFLAARKFVARRNRTRFSPNLADKTIPIPPQTTVTRSRILQSRALSTPAPANLRCAASVAHFRSSAPSRSARDPWESVAILALRGPTPGRPPPRSAAAYLGS